MRDFTSDPANNSTFGTIEFRRRVVNNTGGRGHSVALPSHRRHYLPGAFGNRGSAFTHVVAGSGFGNQRRGNLSGVQRSSNDALYGQRSGNDAGTTAIATKRWCVQLDLVVRNGHAGNTTGKRSFHQHQVALWYSTNRQLQVLCKRRSPAVTNNQLRPKKPSESSGGFFVYGVITHVRGQNLFSNRRF